MIFKSILNPEKYGYELCSYDMDSWGKRGSAPCHAELMVFETYNDGLTKHSGSWCVQFSEFTDAALSLSAAILADPLNPEWKKRLMHCDPFDLPSSNVMDFALGLQFRDDKRQWFNLATCKVTTSQSKQYDKRWKQVETWMNGTAASAVSILLNETYRDWFWRLMLCEAVRDRKLEITGEYEEWEEVFSPVKELKGDWMNALRCLIHAFRSINELHWGQRALEMATGNSQPEETKAA